MSWAVPAIQTTGTLMTAALFNQQIIDNMAALAVHGHTGAAGDGAALNPLPAGIILVFDAACPTGWTRVTDFDGKFLRGAAAYGTTGGASTHTHAYASHTHPHQHSGFTAVAAPETTAIDHTGGSQVSYAATDHTHAMVTPVENAFDNNAAGTSDSASSLPAYADVVFCKRD